MPGAIVGIDLICERLPTGDYKEYTPLGSELIVTVLPMTRSGSISGEGPIPMAMRYPKGAWEAGVDVAVASAEMGERAIELLHRLGEEMARQFREIIMEPPRVAGLLRLETGELFVRLQAEIWPAQQWVVETQLVPRLREAFQRQGLAIPADRIVAFYHLPGLEAEGPAG
jgi:hypothetical protein